MVLSFRFAVNQLSAAVRLGCRWHVEHLEEVAAFVQDGDGAGLAGVDAEDSHALSLRSSAAMASASRSAHPGRCAGLAFVTAPRR